MSPDNLPLVYPIFLVSLNDTTGDAITMLARNEVKKHFAVKEADTAIAVCVDLFFDEQ